MVGVKFTLGLDPLGGEVVRGGYSTEDLTCSAEWGFCQKKEALGRS